jgi:predicted Holliday junction resolvase-like endonuclease
MGILIVLLILYLMTRKELHQLKQIHEELLHEHRSSNIKHGMSFEQLFPFMSTYPYHPRNFRFIGTPIDGLSFEEDKVVFIEFKTGKSSLSSLQQRIKELILRKKVEWKEIRES